MLSKTQPPSVDYIIRSISDEKTLALFNSIADSDGNRSLAKLRKFLTKKKYYTRISGLMASGLIKRHHGEYSLTIFGRVVYDSQMLIGKALTYYGKLKSIEEIEASYGATISKAELSQLINALIDSDQIKDSIIKPIFRTGVATVLT